MVYPYLPPGREILVAPSGNPFIIGAFRAALELSSEHNHPTGSVVVKGGVVLGRAGNQATFRNPHLVSFHKNVFCVRKFLKIRTGEKYWLCPGCASYKMHSEQRAVQSAKKNGADPTGADLYLWGHWWCCKPCWDVMEEAGIARVYVLENSDILFNKEHPDNIIGQSLES